MEDRESALREAAFLRAAHLIPKGQFARSCRICEELGLTSERMGGTLPYE